MKSTSFPKRNYYGKLVPSQDDLGSTQFMTDWAGNVAEFHQYDAYGNDPYPSAIGNPIRYTGRWIDSETGLYDYRNRMYSPALGRFLQRDPLGYVDGMNLFAYVGNNAVNMVDPWGLQALPGELPGMKPPPTGNVTPPAPTTPQLCPIGNNGDDGDDGNGKKPPVVIIKGDGNDDDDDYDDYDKKYNKDKDDKDKDKFKGGKKNERDKGLRGYDNDFKKWFHRQYGKNKLTDATYDEIKEYYQKWLSQGKPINK